MTGTWKKLWAAAQRWSTAAPEGASVPTSDPALLDEIRAVRTRLKCAQRRFDQLEDGDLLEACIYELDALQAQYRFLLRQAKARGLYECPFSSAADRCREGGL